MIMNKDIQYIYNVIKPSLALAIAKNNYKKAIKLAYIIDRIHIFYRIDYDLLYDDDIELLINKLSSMYSSKYGKYEPRRNYFVFCDELAWDNHGLTQQYLHALMSIDAHILYIISSGRPCHCDEITKEVLSYDKGEVYCLRNKKPSLQKITELIDTIYKYKPERILLHSFSMFDATAVGSVKSAVSYRINFGDHAFWSGSNLTNYVIEFRELGKYWSVYKRHIPSNKLFLLPFYPISDNKAFGGFPEHKPDSVICFSGGSSHKMISADNTFLDMINRLVKENPALIIYLAIRGNDSIIKDYISKNGLDGRVLLIGYRKDLTEVLKHSDLYLQTYPLGGGLMCQYAAINGVPILSLLKISTLNRLPIEQEEAFFAPYSYRTYCQSIDELTVEAKKLIENKEYRKIIGDKLKQCVITPEQFNKQFVAILSNNESDNVPILEFPENQSYKTRINDSNPHALFDVYCLVVRTLGFSFISTASRLVPPFTKCFFQNMPYFISKVINKSTRLLSGRGK